VFYIDYGNSERVKLSRVRPLPREVLSYPCQAFACSLANVSVSVLLLKLPYCIFMYFVFIL